ncbi:unnamed protein product [marine sediment metagenome]|uniref:L,D-TPase catalytic domain-containing protein n=1 Tax=marine sediment metagenome TaxID=412755 RepID=X1GG51_9ZZZZ
MIEKGIATNIEDGEVTVNFVPSENCASCKGCACGNDDKTMIMRVKTDRDVSPGDIVTVEVSSRALLSSAFIVFVLPLIVFIIGILSAAPLFRRMRLISEAEYRQITEAVENRRRPPWNTRLGGEIGIHGSGADTDWTRGCIALSNNDVEELYMLVDLGTPVKITRE